MAGSVAECAEVTGRADQPAAEVPRPHAIDEHASRKRVVFGGDCIGQIEPVEVAARGGWRWEHLEEAFRRILALRRGVTANIHLHAEAIPADDVSDRWGRR